MKKKTSLESRLREKYTAVTGRPGTFVIWLEVGNQSFICTPLEIDTKQEAEWFRTMLAKALAQIVKENK